MLYLTPALTIYIITAVIILGLVTGSFFNCLAWRMIHGESIVKGRSHCAHCNHQLAIEDLVPLFSYIALRGRCRYCGQKISWRYPAVELLTALVYLSILLRYDINTVFLSYLILASLLIIVALIDFDSGLIPDRFIITGIVAFILYTLYTADAIWPALLQGLINGLSVSLPLLLLVLIADRLFKRETMGGGDIKLFFMVGLYFDWRVNILLLMLSCVIGIIIALLIKRIRINQPFAFGPSIAIACWVVIIFGQQIINWYLGLFNIV